ncbi:hypothetical protein Q8A73_012492 [Channa argus]|nr:hypothetical protein Q8A73_012492 [Channa argus]
MGFSQRPELLDFKNQFCYINTMKEENQDQDQDRNDGEIRREEENQGLDQWTSDPADQQVTVVVFMSETRLRTCGRVSRVRTQIQEQTETFDEFATEKNLMKKKDFHRRCVYGAIKEGSFVTSLLFGGLGDGE